MMGKGIIRVLYFSPTHTTRTVVRLTSRILSSELGWPVEETDWTPPDSRETELYGETEDLLVLGVSRIRWKGAAPAGGAAVPSEGERHARGFGSGIREPCI